MEVCLSLAAHGLRGAHRARSARSGSPGDARLRPLADSSAAVKSLTTRFTDQFGERIEPSAILIRSDRRRPWTSTRSPVSETPLPSPRSLTASHFASPAGRQDILNGRTSSTSTRLRRRRTITSRHRASRAWRSTARTGFVATGHPTFRPATGFHSGSIRSILAGCLSQWDRRFIRGRQEWKTRVLFRALEIACQASRVPAVGTRTPTIHDMGVGITLWVTR